MHNNSMTLSTCQPCVPGAIRGGLTRTRFYDGMFLTQADLENEQVYWRMKRRLTNRALGKGVVWGLRLEVTQNSTIRLSPGYALDCCGNDLVVECPVETTLQELWDRRDPAVKPSEAEKGIHACIVLQYVECPDQIRPVHRDACNPGGGGCEPSRIRETTRLVLVPPCEIRQPTDGTLYSVNNNMTGWARGPIFDMCLDPYPGPRCTDDHHGVYLGCVRLTQNGTFISFDACECRNYVVLWPLVEYWLARYGIQPFPMMGNMQPTEGSEAEAEIRGAMEAANAVMGPANAIAEIWGSMTGDRTSRFGRNAASNIAEPVIADDDSVAPLSRAPLRDLVAEIVARMPLASVVEGRAAGPTRGATAETAHAAQPTPAFDADVLKRFTVGALLDIGPEAALARLSKGKPTAALSEAVNKLFLKAEDLVRDIAKKTAKHGGTLARAKLGDPKLKDVLLEVKGVTGPAVTAAVAAASRRG